MRQFLEYQLHRVKRIPMERFQVINFDPSYIDQKQGTFVKARSRRSLTGAEVGIRDAMIKYLCLRRVHMVQERSVCGISQLSVC